MTAHDELTKSDRYNLTIQFHNQEIQALNEKTQAFLIVQSIFVAAFATILTTGGEFLPFAFYRFCSELL
jgi:hypothetical protein